MQDPEGERPGPAQAVESARPVIRVVAAAMSQPQTPQISQALSEPCILSLGLGTQQVTGTGPYLPLQKFHLDAGRREFGGRGRAGYHSHACPSWEMMVG